MIFSTPVFVFAFLPVFLAVYYLIPTEWRTVWILFSSWAFYAFWRLDFLSLIIGVSLSTYLFGLWITHSRKVHQRRARQALSLGLAINFGVLAYFKYAGFGIESLSALVSLLGGEALEPLGVILPVGISFYVFQASSYLVDVYREDTPAAPGFIDLAAYIALFPQLIAGPILRYRDLESQFRHREHSFSGFAEGAYRFMFGMCKKVLIADIIANVADPIFAMTSPTFSLAWIGALAYGMQLYFDFSAYSDMAIGLGLMIGFRFRENFDAPYLAVSITDFWNRWHISLSSWLRDYLYIPLGGNRLGTRRTYVNLMLVMVIGGLWHGADWTFVLWGAWHGIFLIAERLIRERKGDSPAVWWKRAVGTSRTFLIVTLGWVLFRAQDLSSAVGMYCAMFGISASERGTAIVPQLPLSGFAALAAALFITFVVPKQKRRIGSIVLIVLFVISAAKMIAERQAPFLYFQF